MAISSQGLNDFLSYIIPLVTFNTNVSLIMSNKQPFSDPKTFGLWAASILQAVVFMLIAIYIDDKRIHSFRGKDQGVQTQHRTQLDERPDVIAHRTQTLANWNADGQSHLIKAQNIMKVYHDGVAAVNGNSFQVAKGEVFGLLGPNGAGKSSMFNVMTMDMRRTSGEVKILDTDIDALNVTQHGNKMGMCPQFNPIWKNLTVDQSLQYIGTVKGLNSEELAFQIEYIKKTLDLGPYSKTLSGNLSGGNKRKLVCAMSLLACPQVEFLDEPTTGVDPVSRRSLFKMLKYLPNCSLILTTHRMDEAESLCDNIAIMINGRFVVYGSPGHLKAAYGEGYTIRLKFTNNGPQVGQYVAQHMPYMKYKDTVALDEYHDGQQLNEYQYEVNTV